MFFRQKIARSGRVGTRLHRQGCSRCRSQAHLRNARKKSRAGFVAGESFGRRKFEPGMRGICARCLRGARRTGRQARSVHDVQFARLGGLRKFGARNYGREKNARVLFRRRSGNFHRVAAETRPNFRVHSGNCHCLGGFGNQGEARNGIRRPSDWLGLFHRPARLHRDEPSRDRRNRQPEKFRLRKSFHKNGGRFGPENSCPRRGLRQSSRPRAFEDRS